MRSDNVNNTAPDGKEKPGVRTLTDALSLVPEFWPLVPGVDKWKEGDEKHWEEMGWAELTPLTIIGNLVEDMGRRPIPQSVRESEARWILYNSLADVEPGSLGHPLMLLTGKVSFGTFLSYNFGVRKISSWDKQKAVIAALSGESAVIRMLTEGPGALWRWVEENRK